LPLLKELRKSKDKADQRALRVLMGLSKDARVEGFKDWGRNLGKRSLAKPKP